MPWQQLTITANSNQSEKIVETLTDLGALSVSLLDAGDDAIFQIELNDAPLWSQVNVIALFEHGTDLHSVLKAAENELQQMFEHSMQTIGDQDWVRETQKLFPAQCYGNKLWVIPAWEAEQHHKNPAVIIDPGLAFGNGNHATTSLCLTWLAEHDINQQAVLDLGCGSGILSLATLALGAEKVWAIDHDPQAIQSTQQNRALNTFANENNCKVHDDKHLPNTQVDLVIANILAQTLIQLADTIIQHCRPNGSIILSGILQSNAGDVIEVYEKHARLETMQVRDEWVLLEFIKYPQP